MIVFGRTNDDKGRQLEQIAQSMLQQRGYQNIRLNSVVAGGAEYDITGEYIIPLAVKQRRFKVIGECKARKDPVNMDDWQKFLGKVYLESIKRKHDITGLLISVSGFNSNVTSSYEEVREHRDMIELVGELEIENFLTEEYSVCTLQQVINVISSLTSRTIMSTEISYYQKACYWIIVFEQAAYTILNSSGDQ
jgi:hypothetical protein